LCRDVLICPSAKIVQSIFDFNSLCSFGRSNFNIHECLRTTVTASLLPASAGYTGHRVRPSTSFCDHSRGISYRSPPVVCVFYGKPREIPRCGCQRNRHGMTLGVGCWRRYCNFCGRDFKSHACFSAIATAVVIFREGMVHRVGNGCEVAPSHVISLPRS
jgi:hypothetical protein